MDNYTNINTSDWNELATPVLKNENQYCNNTTEDLEAHIIKDKINKVSSPVLTIQLVLCLLFLTALFLLKTFYPDLFCDIKNNYNLELTSKLYFSGDFNELDYSSLFKSTDDEV